jgi:hypothetical protein
MPQWGEGRDTSGRRSSLRSWPSLDVPVEAQLKVENYLADNDTYNLRLTLPHIVAIPTEEAVQDYIVRLFPLLSAKVKGSLLVQGKESVFARAVVGMHTDVLAAVKDLIQDLTTASGATRICGGCSAMIWSLS